MYIFRFHPEIVDSWRSIQGEWNLVCADGYKAELLNSLFFIGFGIGAPAFGRMADAVGRRKAFLLATVSSSAGTLLCATASSFEVYGFLKCNLWELWVAMKYFKMSCSALAT